MAQFLCEPSLYMCETLGRIYDGSSCSSYHMMWLKPDPWFWFTLTGCTHLLRVQMYSGGWSFCFLWACNTGQYQNF